jgi:SNF2 family DNA or RNA helicase
MEIRRFKEDSNCRVFVGNPAACAEGISLHHVCHDAVYLDRTFNAGHYMQSVDRIHRLGLAPEVLTHATILQASGTIDGRITSRLDSKILRMARVLDDPGLTTLAMDAPDAGGDEGAVPEDLNDWDDAKAVVEELEED